MRVFFDARMIDHPGIGRYIRGILPLIKDNREVELNILGNRQLIQNYLGIKDKISDFTYPIYSFQEQIGFSRMKKFIGNNLLHIPHYNIPLIGKFNLVVTLHDLTHILYPQGASSKFAPFYMRFMVRKALNSAKKIICVSNSTKNYLEEIFKNRFSNTTVIYEGVNDVFCKIDNSECLKKIKNKYSLPDKFVLYVGSIRRHKNIALLLKVFSKLQTRIKDLWLVLVGRFSQSVNLERKSVIYLDSVSDDRDLAGIYNLASVFCNLSLCEGFNFTILEAQKCELPIICSDIPTHLEIGGEGVLAVPLSDIDRIEEALYNGLTNKSLREALIAKGLENVSGFSWSHTAEKTFEVYKEVDSSAHLV
jgi:glycosyltransferase involved in cell wall biosynthesis